jgi:histidine triad (HIT) family protein
MENCIFCKIIKGDIPSDKVFENEFIIAFLDINPVNPGHTLVIPKEHFSSLEDTPDKLTCEMIKIAKKIGKTLHDAIDADGFNLGLNNGETAGQVVPHVHLHVMPRFKDDGLKLWPGKESSSEERKIISKQVSDALDF